MAKVGLHQGVTLPNPKDKWHNFKADITISEIDTEGDIDAQLKTCLDALEKIAEAVEEPLAQTLANSSGLGIEGIGLATDLTDMIKSNETWRENIVTEIKKLQKAVEDDNSG